MKLDYKMKILEISDRGIKLLEDGEVINQGLFQDEEDIPREVKELLSIYEVSDEIVLKIKLVLDEEILFQIKEVIEEKGWRLRESRAIGKKLKKIVAVVMGIEIFLGLIIYYKVYKVDMENLNIKKEILSYKKNLKQLDTKLSEISLDNSEELEFEKIKIGEVLVFLSKVCKESNVNLEKIEFLDKKIVLNGSGQSINSVFNLKKYVLMDRKIIESKFDFIKKEGEILYFLMELEID